MIAHPLRIPDYNFTRIHNDVFDTIMRQCSGAEFKILLYLMRELNGRNEKNKTLSYNVIMREVGIKARATINTAIHGLIEKKFIIKTGVKRSMQTFSLNYDYEIETESSSKIELDETTTSSKISLDETESSSKIELDNTPGNNPTRLKNELDSANLVQKLNTCKEIERTNILSNANALDSADGATTPPDINQLLNDDIKTITKRIDPIVATITTAQWNEMKTLETLGKNRKTLLDKIEVWRNPPPPGAVIYHEIFTRSWDKDFYADLHEATGDDPTVLDRWRQFLIEVKGCKTWNPTHYLNLIDAFINGDSPKESLQYANRQRRINRKQSAFSPPAGNRNGTGAATNGVHNADDPNADLRKQLDQLIAAGPGKR